MINETGKKEPKVKKENEYVTRDDFDKTLREFAKSASGAINKANRELAEWVKKYLIQYIESIELRPKNDFVGHYKEERDKEIGYVPDELKKLLGTDALELHGKNPLIQEAAMLYIIAEHRREHITQRFITHVYGISEVALRQHIKLLKSLMKKKKLKLSISYFAAENAT
jgi:transcription initiation factor TFIIIB Brf1 subunit/transcription initiation factor TFIIB